MTVNANLLICHDQSDLFRHSAQLVIDMGRDAIQQRGKFHLALSGGSTPKRLYQKLASQYATAIDWKQVHFFWSDERTVPADHEDSNFRMARESLLDELAVDGDKVHRLVGEHDPQQAAADYEQVIRSTVGGDTPIPRFDLILLGLGNDAHTASLFPGTDALFERERLVVANDVPQLSTRRLTMTSLLINQSRSVMFLVSGEGKADALQLVLGHQINPEEFPAQLIVPSNGELLWMVDQAAAGQLEQA